MNLNDLNIICLETVLEYLEIKDLLNAADSNKRLRHAASMVYERKYGEMELHIEHLGHKCWDRNDQIKINTFLISNFIQIQHPKCAFQLLRCFGHVVTSIFGLDYFTWPTGAWERDFLDYINKFCSETLGTLNLCCTDWKTTLDGFRKPFKQVEQLGLKHLNKYQFSTSPANNFFIRIFPKMRSLELLLECSSLMHDGCIVHHIPNLDDLNLCIKQNCHKCDEVYKSIIRLNPQLKKIRFSNLNSLVADKIVDWSEYLQNVEYFGIELNIESDERFSHFNFETLHLKRVKHLTAWSPLFSMEFDCNFMSFIKKLSFDRLESFTLQMCTEPLAEQELEDFCKKNQSIEKLILIICPDTVESVLRINLWLSQTLPLLNELEFTLCDFYPSLKINQKTVTNILSSFKAIPTISISIDHPCEEYFKIEKNAQIGGNFLNNFHNVWSTSWTDYKRKRRLTFKRLNNRLRTALGANFV